VSRAPSAFEAGAHELPALVARLASRIRVFSALDFFQCHDIQLILGPVRDATGRSELRFSFQDFATL
jgi:hypothetical protein